MSFYGNGGAKFIWTDALYHVGFWPTSSGQLTKRHWREGGTAAPRRWTRSCEVVGQRTRFLARFRRAQGALASLILERTLARQSWIANKLAMRSAANVSQQVGLYRARRSGLPVALKEYIQSVKICSLTPMFYVQAGTSVRADERKS